MGIFSRIGKPSETGLVDPILTELVKEDKVPWYKKPNLRAMYMFLFVCCMGVEITSGFDSQLINTLQNSSYFLACKCAPGLLLHLFAYHSIGKILRRVCNRLW